MKGKKVECFVVVDTARKDEIIAVKINYDAAEVIVKRWATLKIVSGSLTVWESLR